MVILFSHSFTTPGLEFSSITTPTWRTWSSTVTTSQRLSPFHLPLTAEVVRTRMDTPPPKRAACNKASPDLKRFAKCKTASYCNHNCQKAHWKTHKRDCKIDAALQDPITLFPDRQVPRRSDSKPFTAIYFNNFLHDRSETQTFKVLIDCLRMRQGTSIPSRAILRWGRSTTRSRVPRRRFGSFWARRRRSRDFFHHGETFSAALESNVVSDTFWVDR